MKFIKKLPDADTLIQEFPLSRESGMARRKRIGEICEILKGKDHRKILIIGPCSADREDAVLVYAERLAKLQKKVQEQLLLIPRIYTAKPRTSGIGYKGLLHSPSSLSKAEDLWAGIIAVRKMHIDVINKTGMFCADEMLYPESIYYTMDLLCYTTIGARSVEDQSHRITASALEMPVGMKNPVSGNLNVLLNSIMAAQHEQTTIFHGWEVHTDGNPFAHAVLRGFQDNHDVMHPNYHYEDLCEFHDLYQKTNLAHMAAIVDCNHCNSRKHYEEQERISFDVLSSCCRETALNRMIKGLMIESYLEDGSQMVGETVFGKSITDGCLGWRKTEKLVLSLAEKIIF